MAAERSEKERRKIERSQITDSSVRQMIGGRETKSRYRMKVAKRNAIRKIYNM
jgi:hypothetical protein